MNRLFALGLVLCFLSPQSATAEMLDSVKKGSRAAGSFFADQPSRQDRENSSIAANLSYSKISYPFSGYGANVHYISSGNWLFGLEYTSASRKFQFWKFDLARFEEKNLLLQAKRFFGNSFNIKMGMGYRRTAFVFAPEIFSVSLAAEDKVSSAETYIARLALANQWHFAHRYTFAIDWISLDIPFYQKIIDSAARYASNQNDQDNIRKAESFLQFYPSVAAFRLEAGVIF